MNTKLKKVLFKESYCESYCPVQIFYNPSHLCSITVSCKKYILPSLPIPKIEIISDHFYLSIIDIVSDILSHRHKIANIKSPNDNNIATICSSPYVTKLRESSNKIHIGFPLISLFIIEWLDDFEPNNMKSNCNSIWIKIVTISPVHEMKKDSLYNTYSILFGSKNSSHESVEVRFKEDLKQLHNGSRRMFYNGATKSMY